MPKRTRWPLVLWLAAAVLGIFSGCGEEETIRVDLLPPGNARGAAATGLYAWAEKVTSTDCPESVTVGTAMVKLPRDDDDYRACADVVQDEGYYGMDLTDWTGGTAGVVHEEFLADGGLWREGQFRIGGVFEFGAGVVARALIDGQYLPPSGTEVVNSFEGVALVQIFTREAGAPERYRCQYEVSFNAHREAGCGD